MVPRSDQSQILQRLRVGATGLVLVVLLIVMASALFRSAIDETPVSDDPALVGEVTNVEPANAAREASPDEPLAELGIAPATPPADNETLPATR